MKDIFAKKDNRSTLERERDDAILLLRTYQPGTEEYEKQLVICERIQEMYLKERELEKHVTPDNILTTLGSVGTVLTILNYERTRNITSKALGFVLKGRLR